MKEIIKWVSILKTVFYYGKFFLPVLSSKKKKFVQKATQAQGSISLSLPKRKWKFSFSAIKYLFYAYRKAVCLFLGL